MAANTTPVFTLVPICAPAAVSAANTNRDGTGTLVDIATGGTNGTRIDIVAIQATVTTTAGMVRFYIFDGTNNRLWNEVAVTATTGTASVAEFRAELFRTDGRPLLILPVNYKLKASTHNAEAFTVVAHGGDY